MDLNNNVHAFDHRVYEVCQRLYLFRVQSHFSSYNFFPFWTFLFLTFTAYMFYRLIRTFLSHIYMYHRQRKRKTKALTMTIENIAWKMSQLFVYFHWKISDFFVSDFSYSSIFNLSFLLEFLLIINLLKYSYMFLSDCHHDAILRTKMFSAHEKNQ